MNPDVMKQVIADALLQEPDMATLYYPRDDTLLVALYNKVKTGVRGITEPDGEREWRSAYRVMPDFENWLNYFADELVIPQ